MKWIDGLRIAFASLIENPLRTFLTLLGIIIGVTAVIFVVSVIEGSTVTSPTPSAIWAPPSSPSTSLASSRTARPGSAPGVATRT